ncbi:MAG: hypothetical protein PF508_14090, partial [Spirochaeta sp.]|nr:hypothetical protein [Spirochaeta sp.]
MLGSVSTNILILLVTTVMVLAVTRAWNRQLPAADRHRARTKRESSKAPRPRAAGDLARGFFAAAGIVAVLIVVRRAFPEIVQTAGPHVAWIAAVVVTEEIVKLALTHRLRPVGTARSANAAASRRRTGSGGALGQDGAPGQAGATGPAPMRRALVRGWGFAAAENLLYLFLLPGRFIIRMV